MLEKTRNDFFDRLALLTEQVLTQRRWIRRIKKEKQKAKNPLLDWLEAFIWAAGVVLLINQYLFQAYQIPSGSMIDTLLIGDRIFVNKVIFGPELLPGMAKLPSPIKPKRNDVIIFENPSYISRGPAFDIAQRIIYMLTLSLVDIDRDESGEPKAHFLIKRAVGWGGDRFVLEQGEFRIRFAGEHRWIREREFNAQRKLNHRLSRLMDAGDYPALEAAGKATAYMDVGLNPPPNLVRTATTAATLRYPDYLAREQARLEVLRGAYPQDSRYRMLFARYIQGWYVPEGRILPLGDNRDNSRDGRYFGPIREAKVLGKGSIIYWPLGRLGPIR
ncbi:MAG: signal peptidase I [Treponema sp.]|jgi:signal peptidase I|nr:signal peptidase I [Treponema sp.]